MMNKTEILDLIDDLNNKSFENNTLDFYSPFEYRSCGWNLSAIYFMDIAIWSDDDDMREYIEDSDERESLKDFLLRESFKIVDDLNKKVKNLKKK